VQDSNASVRMGSESKKGTSIEKWIRHAPLTPKAPSGMTYERRSIESEMVSAGHPCVLRMTQAAALALFRRT